MQIKSQNFYTFLIYIISFFLIFVSLYTYEFIYKENEQLYKLNITYVSNPSLDIDQFINSYDTKNYECKINFSKNISVPLSNIEVFSKDKNCTYSILDNFINFYGLHFLKTLNDENKIIEMYDVVNKLKRSDGSYLDTTIKLNFENLILRKKLFNENVLFKNINDYLLDKFIFYTFIIESKILIYLVVFKSIFVSFIITLLFFLFRNSSQFFHKI